MEKSKKVKIISLIIASIVIIGLIVFMFSGDNFVIIQGLFDKNVSSEELSILIKSMGIRGAVPLSIISMIQIVVTVIPSEPIQVLSGVCYGFLSGTLICTIGVFLGNTVIYLAFKIFGNKLKNYFEANIDLDWDKLRYSKKVAFFIILLYLLPAIPCGFICLFTASMDMKYPRYIFLTTIGALPSIMVDVGLGHMAMSSSWTLSIIVFALIVILLIILAVKRKQIFELVNKMIHKSQEPYKSDTVVKKHNPVILFFVKIAFRLIVKFRFKFTYKKNAEVKGPAIVLVNHGSFYDFLFSSVILKKQAPHFIVARMYFYNKKLAWLLKKAGAFPKSMYANDIENVQNCIRVLKDGRVLVMMPEARLSTAGKFEGIQDATFKFIKKMGVNVYTIKVCGDYLATPKWGDKTRKRATVRAELNLLYSAEELKTAELDQVKQKINTALNYDEFEWLKNNPQVRYKHKKLAVGLENILYSCPVCGKEFTLKTDKRKVFCENCNTATLLDDRYCFDDGVRFSNPCDWYEWQNAELKQEITSNPQYQLRSKVELKLPSLDGKKLLRSAGFGECVLDRSGLTYIGTIDDQETVKKFDMNTIHRILFGAGEDFEIYEGKQLYYFVPEEKRSAVKWYVASGILKEETTAQN